MVHEIECFIDLREGQGVGDKLIHLQFFGHIVIHQPRDTLHTLPAWK